MSHNIKRTSGCLVIFLLVACGPQFANAPTPTPPWTPLPSIPQTIEFSGTNGIRLTGRYYPAAINPAPAIVLMHGGGGRGENWVQMGMVDWLQNRGNPTTNNANLDAPMPAPYSFAVFVFDYRGEWIDAGRAAVEAVKTLPGVDPNRIATMGASVGADSATDACTASGCLGTLGFSPTGSLEAVRYEDSIAKLGNENKIAWCIATEGEGGCPPATGRLYRAIVKPGVSHGLGMFASARANGIWQDTLDFLECVFTR